MIRTDELDAAVQQWLRYKASLNTAKTLQSAGMSVPNTRMRDFVSENNAAARRLVSALETTDAEYLEALGELAITASRHLIQQRTDKTFVW